MRRRTTGGIVTQIRRNCRRRRWPSRCAVTLLLIVAACTQSFRPADITFATLSDDGLTLFLSVEACQREVEQTVVETFDSVTVEYLVIPKRGDCGYEGVVELTAPLGDRVLIDAFDGQPIPLSPYVPPP